MAAIGLRIFGRKGGLTWAILLLRFTRCQAQELLGFLGTEGQSDREVASLAWNAV
jgi:hypothetical protein